MSRINPKRKVSIKEEDILKKSNPHVNNMGGTSYDVNPLTRLKMSSASCFFGEPMYYNKDSKDKNFKVKTNRLSDSAIDYLRTELNSIDDYKWRNMTPQEIMETAIDESLDYNAEETLKFAVELRTTLNIRTTPQIILVRAANKDNIKGTNLIRKYGNSIIVRPDELTVCLAYNLSAYGRKLPMSLKRLLKDKLENLSEFQATKYRMENNTVKLVDVVRFTHPKSPVIDKLCRDELKLSNTNDDGIKTWESIRSSGGSWEDSINVMGHMSLLRNLRNFAQNKVNTNLYVKKLVDTMDGKQLPFRYFSAYNAVGESAPASVLESIETCLKNSISNLPMFEGNALILSDNSGSAQSTTTSSMGTVKVNEIGNLMGILTGMRSENGKLGIFGDRLEYLTIKKNSSILDQLEKANTIGSDIGGGTENGVWLALDEAIKNKIHYDTIWIYSDMQAGHGGLYGIDSEQYSEYIWKHNGTSNYIDVSKMIKTYRNTVNPNVFVFLVQTAGYTDTLVPEFYDKTYILGGWSENILKFAEEMIKLNNNN